LLKKALIWNLSTLFFCSIISIFIKQRKMFMTLNAKFRFLGGDIKERIDNEKKI